jgi:hypothetical protein
MAHDFQLERTIEWPHARADVVATIAAVASAANFIVFPPHLLAVSCLLKKHSTLSIAARNPSKDMKSSFIFAYHDSI